MDQLEDSDFKPSLLPPEKAPSSFRLSLTNILCLVVLGVSLAWSIWAQLSYSRLAQVPWPEYGLPIFVSRMMELKEVLKKTPAWEGKLYRVLSQDTPNDLPLAISWYEELAATSSEPQIRVQLAILDGESGRIEEVRQQVAEWEHRKEPYPQFAQLIRAAYLNPAKMAGDVNIRLIHQIGPRWFRERLMERLARQDGDPARWLESSELTLHSARMLALVRLFAATGIIITMGGSLALFFLLFQSQSDPQAVSMGTASIPPCWSGTAGTVVLVRSAAIFILLNLGGGFLEEKTGFSVPLVWLGVSAISILALLGLAHRYLLRPLGLEIRQAFGLSLPEEIRGRLFLWVVALLAAASLGEWGVVWISERVGLPIHWTESFDSDSDSCGEIPPVSVLKVSSPLCSRPSSRNWYFAGSSLQLSEQNLHSARLQF